MSLPDRIVVRTIRIQQTIQTRTISGRKSSMGDGFMSLGTGGNSYENSKETCEVEHRLERGVVGAKDVILAVRRACAAAGAIARRASKPPLLFVSAVPGKAV